MKIEKWYTFDLDFLKSYKATNAYYLAAYYERVANDLEENFLSKIIPEDDDSEIEFVMPTRGVLRQEWSYTLKRVLQEKMKPGNTGWQLEDVMLKWRYRPYQKHLSYYSLTFTPVPVMERLVYGRRANTSSNTKNAR